MVFVILQITNNVKLKAMKNVLLILTLCVGMVACSGGKTKSVAENQQTKKDVVEVLYFHGAQRCATCMAIEKNTKELLEAAYAEQLKSGKSAPLKNITSGYHFHRITAESDEILDEIETALKEKGFLIEYLPNEFE